MANRNGGFIGTDGLDAPDPPTDVTPTAGDTQLSIAFTAPADAGTSAITGFVAQVASSGDNYSAGSNTGSSSPIVVSSLSNGTSYTAKVWAINAYGTSAPSDASASATPLTPTIGLLAGGYSGSATLNVIQKLIITTAGNSTDFGDLSSTRNQCSGSSSSTRAVFGGGEESVPVNTMEYVTIANTGNATDFGDMVAAHNSRGACANDTRLVFAGGEKYSGGSRSSSNVIDYITIASTGNATDAGDLSAAINTTVGFSNTTRAVYHLASGSNLDTIEFTTFSSTGDTSDFGNLSVSRSSTAACCSSTRGIVSGGYVSSDNSNVIDYVTTASTGNATDFGDLDTATRSHTGVSDKTTGVFCGGVANPKNHMQSITMASTGNASDFGTLVQATSARDAGASDSHGGIA